MSSSNYNLILGINLHTWQNECLEKWQQNNYRGIANVATGAGKTILAAAGINLLENKLSEKNELLKVKIIVPKVFLAGQWLDVLINILGVSRSEIGLYHGKRKENESRKYMIYVLNSARYRVARQILEECNTDFNVLLICDECHHFGSEENSKIFDFLPHIDKNRYFSLGLSVTLDDEDEALNEKLGGEIYRYGFDMAVKTGVVSDYSVFNISLDFSPEEAQEYNALTDRFYRYLSELMRLRPQLKALRKVSFYSELKSLASKTGEYAELASGILGALYKRKETAYLAQSRISCTAELLKRLVTRDVDSRIIVFAERISTIEKLHSVLKKMKITAGKYHSKLGENACKLNLERYKNGEVGILLSCHALDEGFNVPETDIGIIMSTTGSIRQRIQRLGRVLRKSDTSHMKSVYYLHIGDSTEEDELLSNENSNDNGNIVLTFNLRFLNGENDFENPEYDLRCHKLLEQLIENETPPKILDEVVYNLKLGAVRTDWLLSKAECRKRIKNSTSASERNYFIVVKRLINLP